MKEIFVLMRFYFGRLQLENLLHNLLDMHRLVVVIFMYIIVKLLCLFNQVAVHRLSVTLTNVGVFDKNFNLHQINSVQTKAEPIYYYLCHTT